MNIKKTISLVMLLFLFLPVGRKTRKGRNGTKWPLVTG